MMATDPAQFTGSANKVRRSPDGVDEALAHVREALLNLEYGEISIVVQDGVVIQIERTERKRLRRRAHK